MSKTRAEPLSCAWHVWYDRKDAVFCTGCFVGMLRTRLSGEFGHQLGEEKQVLVSDETLENMLSSA